MIVAVHVLIASFLIVRMVQHRAPLRAKPWNEVALAARVFLFPATALGMGRRIRASQNRRIPLFGADEPGRNPAAGSFDVGEHEAVGTDQTI